MNSTSASALHACGGTILGGGETNYCDECGAYAYHYLGAEVPDGCDKVANREALDNGDGGSPSAVEAPEDLLGLLALMRDRKIRDWTDLPTFGGAEPEDTSEVWSWDETNLIVGSSPGGLSIVLRAEHGA